MMWWIGLDVAGATPRLVNRRGSGQKTRLERRMNEAALTGILAFSTSVWIAGGIVLAVVC